MGGVKQKRGVTDYLVLKLMFLHVNMKQRRWGFRSFVKLLGRRKCRRRKDESV